MPAIRAFRGLRFVPSRVDLGAVVAPAPSSDPRHVAHLLDDKRAPDDGKDGPLRRARTRLAEWQRAGVVLRDAQPAMYVVKRKDASGEAVGLFCVLGVDAATGNSDAAREARLEGLGVAVEPVVARFDEARVRRTLENAVDREADASWRVGPRGEAGASFELWCVDEESTTARIATLLSQAPIEIESGAEALAAQASWWKAKRAATGDDDRPRAGAFALAFLHAGDESWPAVPVGAAFAPVVGTLE